MKMSLSKMASTITDLPADVIGLVFEYLPLFDVLLNQSLVCKVFYQAHLQHCRSAVRRLTLVGHQMVNIGGRRKKEREIVPLSYTDHKPALIKFARLTGDSSTRVINASTFHLQLVPGREEAAYEMIGKKFKSITHLELCQLSLEIHYKQIVKMFKVWNAKGRSSQLADFKLFFKPSEFSHNGDIVRGFKSNKSRCLAYIFGEGLTPSVTPALRNVTLNSFQIGSVTLSNEINHNEYKGPQNNRVDLSALESINALDFSVCKVSVERLDANGNNNVLPPNLQNLTIALNFTTPAPAFHIFQQLRSLIITFVYVYKLQEYHTYFDGACNNLRRLTLNNVYQPLSNLIQEFIAPFVTVNEYGVNNSLEYLRVDFDTIRFLPLTNQLFIRFQMLTTLHLVKTNLLHSNEYAVLSYIFPNLVHLRLDGNIAVMCYTDLKDGKFERACAHCRAHIITKVEQRLGRVAPTKNIQFIESSTAEICKNAFVREAMAAWPQLLKITIQIEDFYEHALDLQIDLTYIFASETIILRDTNTGEAVPEADRVWTVKKIPY